MKKTIVCIFAHPDDEAFGPAGTIGKYAKDNDVYLMCATLGEAGGDPDVRRQELLSSAKILGIKKVIFLGFRDGSLCNEIYHQIASKVKTELKKIQPEILITFEPRGISGHIDHVTITMVTTYLFEHLSFVKTLLYYCLTEEHTKLEKEIIRDYFIYFPPGYKKDEITKTIDVSAFWDKKIQAIKSHKSQKKDAHTTLAVMEKLPKQECFIVIHK